jgi:hypothetical protein
MRPGLAAGLAWASAGVAVAAFFLPWARFDARPPAAALGRLGNVTLEIRANGRTVNASLADLSSLPPVVRGADIPRLARDENARAGVMVWEMLTGKPQHVEAKSLAVYLVPALAVLGALALSLLQSRRTVSLAIALACAAAAALGAHKLATFTSGAASAAVSIGPGLWISIGAYAGLAAAAVMMSLQGREAT